MNSREAIKCLCQDMEKIELPPISEKVLLTLSEQRQKYIEYTKKAEALNKQKNDKIKKYVFAAMLALLAVSVPVVVVITNHAPISDLPNAPVLPGSSEAASISESQIATSTAESETALEHIKLKQSYGEVALSGKSEEELEMLLVTYSKENSAYEDEQYIYNFDSQGRLLEMRKTVFGDEEGQPVDEQTISSNVNALLKEYYPDWLESECDIRIKKNEGSRFLWTADVIKTNDDFTKEILYITFEKTGFLKEIICSGNVGNVGVISKAEAVQIALEELRSGKYNILEFDNKDISIIVSNKGINNESYYEISLDKIPYKMDDGEIYYKMLIFSLNCNTGDCSLIDQSI